METTGDMLNCFLCNSHLSLEGNTIKNLQDIKCIDLVTEEDKSQFTCAGLQSRSSDGLLQGSDPEDFVSLFPPEIWLKIFQEFSPYELCNIGLTCKSFLALTRDSSLWTEISLVGDAIASTRSVTQLFIRCSHLLKVR